MKTSFRVGSVMIMVLINTLAAVSWIAYDRLQPVVLQVLEVSDERIFLDLVRSVVMVVVPVSTGWIAGTMSFRKDGSVLVVASGLSLAAIVFIGVAMDLRWFLIPSSWVPFMIFMWLVGMNMFLGPANSLLVRYTERSELAFAVSLSIVMADILYAAENLIGDLLYSIGLMPVFAGAGIALAVVALVFNKQVTEEERSEVDGESGDRKNNLVAVALTGLAAGLLLVTIQSFLPIWVMAKAAGVLQSDGKELIVPAVLVIAAVVAVPSSGLISRIGVKRSLAFGLGGTVLSLAFTFMVPDAYATLAGTFATGIFLGLLMVAVFPFAVSCLKEETIPFGTGLLFS
ncbi:MAG: MFS transporter, partial [Bacteroidota bacterium]